MGSCIFKEHGPKYSLASLAVGLQPTVYAAPRIRQQKARSVSKDGGRKVELREAPGTIRGDLATHRESIPAAVAQREEQLPSCWRGMGTAKSSADRLTMWPRGLSLRQGGNDVFGPSPQGRAARAYLRANVTAAGMALEKWKWGNPQSSDRRSLESLLGEALAHVAGNPPQVLQWVRGGIKQPLLDRG